MGVAYFIRVHAELSQRNVVDLIPCRVDDSQLYSDSREEGRRSRISEIREVGRCLVYSRNFGNGDGALVVTW